VKPTRSDNARAMSRADLESLRRALDSDLGALLALLDENVQWDYVGAFPETVTYHGPEEVAGFFSEWVAGFDDFGFEAEEAIEAGESVVVGLHQWGRGKETGAEVESRTWQVFRFRDGRIVSCRGYPTRAEALTAASGPA
jgi:ketosteroid isomerase-like protein